jgi:hypothetical protein
VLYEARDITDEGLIAGNGLRAIQENGGLRQVRRGFLLEPIQAVLPVNDPLASPTAREGRQYRRRRLT